MDIRKRIYFVLGGPGSGKGTFCKNMVTKNPNLFAHLSAGDLLRKFNKNHDPINSPDKDKERFKIIDNCIKEGSIVPAEITIGLILDEISVNEMNCFLIDGFPRNQGNYDGWVKLSQERDNIETSKLLYLDCSEDTMLARINKRASESKVKRVDDNIEAFRKRIKVFLGETMPIVNIFDSQGKCVKIDSEKTQEDMYQQIKDIGLFKNLN